MSDDRTKLEKTFNLPKSETELLDQLEEMFNFSSNPTLNEVAKMALEAYKQQMMDIMHFEPKYRSRALEVAAQYLSLAKDSLSKEEDLRLKEEKQNQSKNEGDDGDGETIDRNEILLELDGIRKNKKL